MSRPGLQAQRGGPRRRPLFALQAVIGALAGVAILWLHLTTDPLVDVHAYYEAAARLNAGQPLYPPHQDVNGPYALLPSSLGILFPRLLFCCPWMPAAAISREAVVIASFVVTVLGWMWPPPRRHVVRHRHPWAP